MGRTWKNKKNHKNYVLTKHMFLSLLPCVPFHRACCIMLYAICRRCFLRFVALRLFFFLGVCSYTHTHTRTQKLYAVFLFGRRRWFFVCVYCFVLQPFNCSPKKTWNSMFASVFNYVLEYAFVIASCACSIWYFYLFHKIPVISWKKNTRAQFHITWYDGFFFFIFSLPFSFSCSFSLSLSPPLSSL